MHKDVEPFVKIAADAQKAYQDAFRGLQDAGLEATTALWQAWTDAKDKLDVATVEMYRASMEAANLAPGHPLWNWLEAREAEIQRRNAK
jgi:hypothetical protein